ncbi:MAG: TetR/AcrR family transcriptional regulator [Phenylobacterium sp.]
MAAVSSVMNQISPVPGAASSPSRPPTRRTLAKQQTRLKVLTAGRRLFSEEGYEGATIRDIATAAGMSTGAVFANFADKADLFREIMTSDMIELQAAMRDAAPKGHDVEDAVLRAYMAGYEFYEPRLQLARAALSVSWDREGGQALRSVAGAISFPSVFEEILTAAEGRGELVKNTDIGLLARMLYEIYLSNFRQAIFERWSLEALEARARKQIHILLAGARRG